MVLHSRETLSRILVGAVHPKIHCAIPIPLPSPRPIQTFHTWHFRTHFYNKKLLYKLDYTRHDSLRLLTLKCPPFHSTFPLYLYLTSHIYPSPAQVQRKIKTRTPPLFALFQNHSLSPNPCFLDSPLSSTSHSTIPNQQFIKKFTKTQKNPPPLTQPPSPLPPNILYYYRPTPFLRFTIKCLNLFKLILTLKCYFYLPGHWPHISQPFCVFLGTVACPNCVVHATAYRYASANAFVSDVPNRPNPVD